MLRLRTALTAGAGLMALLGCAHQKDAPELPAPPGVMQCGLPATAANTCEAGRPICHVYVFGKADKPYVYPHRLDIPRRGNFTIVWHLLDTGAEFRSSSDGPDLHGNSKFGRGGPTTDPDGNPGNGQAAKHYRFDFKDMPGAPRSPHQYTIKFKTASGAEASCDPYIANESN